MQGAKGKPAGAEDAHDVSSGWDTMMEARTCIIEDGPKWENGHCCVFLQIISAHFCKNGDKAPLLTALNKKLYGMISALVHFGMALLSPELTV